MGEARFTTEGTLLSSKKEDSSQRDTLRTRSQRRKLPAVQVHANSITDIHRKQSRAAGRGRGREGRPGRRWLTRAGLIALIVPVLHRRHVSLFQLLAQPFLLDEAVEQCLCQMFGMGHGPDPELGRASCPAGGAGVGWIAALVLTRRGAS